MAERSKWYEIMGCLEDIMTERLDYHGITVPPLMNNIEMIKLMKVEGTIDSDTWIADICVCIRRILKEEFNVNIELYKDDDAIEEKVVKQDDETQPIQPCLPELANEEEDEETSPEDTFDLIPAEGIGEEVLSDLKDLLCQELSDENIMYDEINMSIKYFNSQPRGASDGIVISNVDDLLETIKELSAFDMEAYLNVLYKDPYLAFQIDNILIGHA